MLAAVAEELGEPARCRRTQGRGPNKRRARGVAAAAPRSPNAHRGTRDPQKSRGLFRQAGQRDPAVIFRFIAAKKAEHSIKTMCRVLGVSRSGYHAWERRPPSARALADARLTERIRVIHETNRKVYGSPRIHAELLLADGERVGRKRIERLMREAGITGRGRRSGVGRRSGCRASGSVRTSSIARSSRPRRTGCGSL